MDGNSTDASIFSWVGKTSDGKNAFGFEGKIPDFYDQFPLGVVTLSINVHVNVEGATLGEEGETLTSGLVEKSITLSLPKPEGPGSSIPIDGGLGFLLAAGLGYGVYKRKK